MNDYSELERFARAAKTRGPWCFIEVYCPKPKSSNPYQRDHEYCVAEVRHRHDGNHLRDIYYKEDAEFQALTDPDTILALLAELKVSTNVGRSLTETLESVCESRDALARAVEQLKAENEAMRKDVERYRWLRDQQEFMSAEFLVLDIDSGTCIEAMNCLSLDELDARVDDAMNKRDKP